MSTSASPGLAFIAVVGAALIVAAPLFRNLLSVSSKHPYAGHVIIVPIFATVLLWLDRHRLHDCGGRRHASGMALTTLAVGLMAAGYTGLSVPLQAVSFVGLVGGIVLWFYGVRGVRRTGFVLAFLLLMLPPPREAVAALAPGIQSAVAAFSAVMLQSLHVPVVHEGVFLRLPDVTLIVAEECAGLRFSLILFVSVCAFARVVLPTTWGQLILVGTAIPVAMLANAIRVAATSVGAYVVGPQVATGPLHYYIGKSFWGLALLAMVVLAWWLRAWSHPVSDQSQPRASFAGP